VYLTADTKNSLFNFPSCARSAAHQLQRTPSRRALHHTQDLGLLRILSIAPMRTVYAAQIDFLMRDSVLTV